MKIVLIWASNNPEKFWNKILKDLISKWYKVFPVNLKENIIENIKCYKNIEEINVDFDIVNFVVPPKTTLKILENNKNLLQNKKIWIQPWSSNENVIDFLRKNYFKDYIVESCIMLENIKK